MSLKPIISAKNVNVTYFAGKTNQVNALINASADIYPGEFIIFFGPSGCGKSTFLYSIAGLERKAKGDIFINGENLQEFNEKRLEEHYQTQIGMIFQAFYLIGSLSVLKNVILPQFSLGVKDKDRNEKAINLLDKFGVSLQMAKYPTELSGGQQQRVSICRALINDPQIILADEPVGNLDSKSAKDVMDLLLDLNKKEKKTVILVTHSPDHLNLAHRVFFMKDGRIVQVKVNKHIEGAESIPSLKSTKPLEMTKDLQLLSKTYTDLSPESLGPLLIPFKAREIVSDIITGMTSEGVELIEEKVVEMLKKGIFDEKYLIKFLDKDISEGGMGLDKRTAKKLAEKIRDIIKEIKVLEAEESKILKGEIKETEEVSEIRRYLLDMFDVELDGIRAVNNFNLIIKDRLEGKIDAVEVRRRMDMSLIKGGAGLHKSKANKIARRLELLMLGKYNPERDIQKPPKINNNGRGGGIKNNIAPIKEIKKDPVKSFIVKIKNFIEDFKIRLHFIKKDKNNTFNRFKEKEKQLVYLGKEKIQKEAGAVDEDKWEMTPIDTSYTKKHVAVITKFDPGSIYKFKIEALDSGGSSSFSRIYTILSPRQKETVFQVILNNIEKTFGWTKSIGF